MQNTIQDISDLSVEARERIDGIVAQTPLIFSPVFSERTGANVHFKLENEQRTGSFKLRGATNSLMSLTSAQREAGCVAASSGNHGVAIACAMRELGISGVIFVPEQTSSAKVDAIRRYGGNVEFFGNDGLDTEQHARAFAEEKGMRYLSPYNDLTVVAGQGTCGVEIVEQLPDVDDAFIAVGGGGLIGGVGCVLKHHNPAIRLYGCQPEASAVMAKSVEAGQILDIPSETTLSDGTAGGVEPDSITFELCRDLVEEFVIVSEASIATAMRTYMASEPGKIEGAAGVALAALEASKAKIAGRTVVVIICGGNISAEALNAIA